MSKGGRNFGGSQSNLNGIGHGALDLSPMLNAQAQQSAAINQAIGDTARLIYVQLISRMQITQDGVVDAAFCRMCAKHAIN